MLGKKGNQDTGHDRKAQIKEERSRREWSECMGQMDASMGDWVPARPQLGITLWSSVSQESLETFIPTCSYLVSSPGSCEFGGLGWDREDYFLPQPQKTSGLENTALEYFIDTQVPTLWFGILESVFSGRYPRRCATKKITKQKIKSRDKNKKSLRLVYRCRNILYQK